MVLLDKSILSILIYVLTVHSFSVFLELYGCVSRRKSAAARFLRMHGQVGGSKERPTVQLGIFLYYLFY